jgi:phosphoglucomutase
MNYKQIYEQWLNEPTLEEEHRKELLSYSEKEIEDAFYQEVSFGTGGIRGLMGIGPNRVNIYTVRKATLGLAKYLLMHKKLNGVAIAYDNRKDSRTFAFEAAKVLAACGIKSFVFPQLRPTPMLSFAVRYKKTSAGIMITASHNPKEYNGFKVYNETGAQMNVDEANAVINQINMIASPFGIHTVENDLINLIDEDVEKAYIKLVETISIKDEPKQLKLTYSPLHGTGGTVIPTLLAKHGYEVYPVLEQMKVDPTFSQTKSSNPEEELAYELSLQYAKKYDADIVLVTDPDADRLGIAVKHNGVYQLINGNQTASLTLYYILKHAPKQEGFVYTTIVTSALVKEIALSFNQRVGETLTGFKFIGEQAELKQNIPYRFGCEESYGSLIKDFVRDKDAVQACFMLAEIANHYKREGKTLVDVLEEIYKTYGYYVEHTENITLKGKSGGEKIKAIMNYVRIHGLHIPSFKVEHIIDYNHGYVNPNHVILPPSDVVKFVNNDGFIVFRPSGTEPKLKIYFSIKKNEQTLASNYVKLLVKEVMDIIHNI